jgi:hypothetical protein
MGKVLGKALLLTKEEVMIMLTMLPLRMTTLLLMMLLAMMFLAYCCSKGRKRKLEMMVMEMKTQTRMKTMTNRMTILMLTTMLMNQFEEAKSTQQYPQRQQWQYLHLQVREGQELISRCFPSYFLLPLLSRSKATHQLPQ